VIGAKTGLRLLIAVVHEEIAVGLDVVVYVSTPRFSHLCRVSGRIQSNEMIAKTGLAVLIVVMV
jgi:hypothetical protein